MINHRFSKYLTIHSNIHQIIIAFNIGLNRENYIYLQQKDMALDYSVKEPSHRFICQGLSSLNTKWLRKHLRFRRKILMRTPSQIILKIVRAGKPWFPNNKQQRILHGSISLNLVQTMYLVLIVIGPKSPLILHNIDFSQSILGIGNIRLLTFNHGSSNLMNRNIIRL